MKIFSRKANFVYILRYANPLSCSKLISYYSQTERQSYFFQASSHYSVKLHPSKFRDNKLRILQHVNEKSHNFLVLKYGLYTANCLLIFKLIKHLATLKLLGVIYYAIVSAITIGITKQLSKKGKMFIKWIDLLEDGKRCEISTMDQTLQTINVSDFRKLNNDEKSAYEKQFFSSMELYAPIMINNELYVIYKSNIIYQKEILEKIFEGVSIEILDCTKK